MKKYSIVISLFAMLLTACDPTVEEEGSIAASMTEAQLEQAATLMQTVEGQNKFTYATNPSTTVQILDPSGNILTTGTSGSFDLTPGGEESQTFTIRTINQDGSITSFQKTFSITTYVDVDPAWAYLCGDGEKVWTYDSEVLGGCWGNLGYKAASNAEDFITNKNGIWWTSRRSYRTIRGSKSSSYRRGNSGRLHDLHPERQENREEHGIPNDQRRNFLL